MSGGLCDCGRLLDVQIHGAQMNAGVKTAAIGSLVDWAMARPTIIDMILIPIYFSPPPSPHERHRSSPCDFYVHHLELVLSVALLLVYLGFLWRIFFNLSCNTKSQFTMNPHVLCSSLFDFPCSIILTVIPSANDIHRSR